MVYRDPVGSRQRLLERHDAAERRFDRMFRLTGVLIGAIGVATVLAIAGAIYVGVHFLRKVW